MHNKTVTTDTQIEDRSMKQLIAIDHFTSDGIIVLLQQSDTLLINLLIGSYKLL